MPMFSSRNRQFPLLSFGKRRQVAIRRTCLRMREGAHSTLVVTCWRPGLSPRHRLPGCALRVLAPIASPEFAAVFLTTRWGRHHAYRRSRASSGEQAYSEVPAKCVQSVWLGQAPQGHGSWFAQSGLLRDLYTWHPPQHMVSNAAAIPGYAIEAGARPATLGQLARDGVGLGIGLSRRALYLPLACLRARQRLRVVHQCPTWGCASREAQACIDLLGHRSWAAQVAAP